MLGQAVRAQLGLLELEKRLFLQVDVALGREACSSVLIRVVHPVLKLAC